MKTLRREILVLSILGSAFLVGCASTGTSSDSQGDPNVLTREQIMEVGATNLYDVVHRLRPRWLRVSTVRSFNMENEVIVMQNDMYLGGTDALRQMSPELAYEMRYMDGTRAANLIPGLMSGRHIEGAIIISTRSGGGGT